MTKDEFRAVSAEKGFADAAFVSMRSFDKWREDVLKTPQADRAQWYDPRKEYPWANCLIVLQYPFLYLADGVEPHYSRYYIASNRSYFAVKELCADLRAYGRAELDTKLPVRAAALRGGGILGDSGFYISQQHGPSVALQMIVTDVFEPDPDGTAGECTHCGRCASACPTKALTKGGRRDIEKCLRYMECGGYVKEKYRSLTADYLGCDLCQKCCPMGSGERAVPEEGEHNGVSLDAAISGRREPLSSWIGKNYAKPRLCVKNALLYIGAHKMAQYAADIRRWIEDEDEIIREYAAWALAEIDKSSDE